MPVVAPALAAPDHPETTDDSALARQVVARLAPVARVAAAEQRAAEAVESTWPSPRLVLRQEEPGDTSRTTAAGLEVALDLSGRTDRARTAGVALGQAARHEARQVRAAAVCAARALALEAQAAEATVALRRAAHAALEGLAAEVDRLVAGREKAAFEAERVAAQVVLHRQALALDEARAAAARAALEARVGPVGTLRIEPAQPTLAWSAAVLAESPRLLALRQRGHGAGLRRAVGERGWVPAVGVYGGWRRDEAGNEAVHGFEAGLSLELPLVDRGAPVRAAADAEQARALADEAALAVALQAEVAALAAELARLESTENDKLSDTLAERARKRYRSGVDALADLFATYEVLEAGALARQARVDRQRHLRLAWACALGRFPEPGLEAVLEEAAR